MKRYVDLSGKLENGLWSYRELPGLETIIPEVEIETVATVARDGFFASKVSAASISGTYLEAGAHILEDARNLDDYSVEDYIKPATIIRLPRQGEKALIQAELLAAHAPQIGKGEALIVDTGWGSRWNTPGFVLQCPNFSRSAVEWLLEHEPAICGFDVTCIESSWSEDAVEEKGGLLGLLFKTGALLLAPLVNLDKTRQDRGMLYALPLSAEGMCGAPVRAVWEEEA
ncbi:MAG: cyclase family protein [Spirochaetales bacterium]|nr:cyclase family protein [Spirochaetales bacterium]